MTWFETALGLVAAFCTTVSYVPQVKKAWTSGSTGDLSFKMIALLFLGISLWLAYGILKADPVIIIANAAGLGMIGILAFLKVKELRGKRAEAPVSALAHRLFGTQPRHPL